MPWDGQHSWGTHRGFRGPFRSRDARRTLLLRPHGRSATMGLSFSQVGCVGAPGLDATAEFEWLFHAECPAVMRTVCLICQDRNRAQDITQDAFVQLLRHWNKVSRYERPGAWLRRVAIRLAMQAGRRERLRSLLERDVHVPETAISADIDVMNAIRSLPQMQRAVVVLFYFDDIALNDIAEMLGCSPATVRVHLHHARSSLAELLREEAVEDVP